ncbi:TonB-linked outer membrane protein, SusC/RagA family [Flavobacterium gillisiae]|uniref:TonB-linked outer membrane protein, SusC/RagA family n=1 Tax=Flavobacterium gillisiae TaxID=150146 RepID=A0A1H3Z0A1_9FLAO|nr:SusC/RagA family TonB-linked outer membrane protein [Flavobacterium gillisiae]SEA17243.1 TonB-linked outer membrane protein, SusC/RagA family [Flavobacterium gillisiae]
MKKKYLILLLLFLGIITSYSQNTTVKGKVTDAKGLPLPGANVNLKGSKSTVATDMDGTYQIQASNGASLIFSYIGFKNQEIKVSGNTINASLKEDTETKLDEVVVTAMGIKNKTKSLGYANQTIKASDIERPGQLNALQSLQGSISGVTISKTSGEAGGGVDILIRGVSSLSTGSNNQPLIVIDGNPVNNSTISGNVLSSANNSSPGSNEQFGFSNRSIDINPNDIESYTVLKGAGATALYGILAGNGVIIITTKKGKEGKTRVNISSSVTMSDVNKYPELQSKWREGSSLTPRVLSMNATTPSGISFYPGFTSAFQSNGPAYSSTDDASIKFRHFYKDFFKTGINTTNNISLSGGTEKMNYYVSASTSKDEGIVPNTDYARKTLKFNGGYKLSENLKLGTSVSYANSGGSRANTGDKSIMSSLSYWSPSIYVNDYLTKAGAEKDWTSGIIDQPVYFAKTSNLNDNVDRWIASADLNWQAKSWLNITYRGSVDNYAESRNRYAGPDLDPGSPVNGFIVNEKINFKGLNSDFLVSATKKFGDFNTSAMIGNQIFETNSDYSLSRGEGLLLSNFNNIANTINKYAAQTNEVVRTVGYFTELKADYKERIFLAATGRRDYASTLPAANRAFNYFSSNLAFVFHDLIDKEGSVLSFGKLRGSWAQVGKIPPFGIGRYSYPDIPFNGVGGVSIGTVDSDPNIKAEIVTTTEMGTDLRFFNNRIRLEYTYFDRKSDGQILKVTLPQSTGLTGTWTNSGSLQTTGHELTLAADIFKNKDFTWTTIANFTAYKTEVLTLPFDNIDFAYNGGADIYSRIKVGDAAGSLYGRTWTYVNGQRLIGTNGLPVIAKDTNGAVLYSKVGNAFPDYVVTLNNNFKYKNWDLAFMFEYKKGGEGFDPAERNGIRNGILKMTEDRNHTQVLEGVKADGTQNNTPVTIDGNSYYRNTIINQASEILIQDTSWLKLRNVSLTYNLASDLTSKLKLSNASFSVSGNNFLLWTPFRGFDPEGQQFGSGSNVYGFSGLNIPLTQSYTLGLNIGF